MTTTDETNLERLADLLMSNMTPENVMDISTMDGFMTAAQVLPDSGALETLLPWIWDLDDGEARPVFKNTGQEQELLGLIAAHWESIARTLDEVPEDYQPVLFQSQGEDDDAEPVTVMDDWCHGFVMGLRLQDKVFESLPDDLKDLLGPIFLYGTDEGWEELERLDLTADQQEEIADALPDIVTTLHAHFSR